MVLPLYEERRFKHENMNKTRPKTSSSLRDQVLKFHSYVINLQKTYNFELSQTAHVGEVPLTFDVLSKRTVDVKGVKTMAVKTSEENTFHCCADGTNLPPMIIFKRKTFPKERF